MLDPTRSTDGFLHTPLRLTYGDSEQSVLRDSQGDLLPLRETERTHVLLALIATKGNKREAARKLGISRVSLYDKIRRYRLGEFKPRRRQKRKG